MRKKLNSNQLLLGLVVLFFTISCTKTAIPKPRGYFRIEFEGKKYQTTKANLPYSFEFPTYAVLQKDSSAIAEPYWMNLEFKSHKATLHISYKTIQKNFNQLEEDSRNLAYKHAIKADAINEKQFADQEKHTYGILYQIKGDAASPLQFFVTDSTTHFMRGSLYFNSVPNKDSLAPVVDFLTEDIMRLVESIKWTNN